MKHDDSSVRVVLLINILGKMVGEKQKDMLDNSLVGLCCQFASRDFNTKTTRNTVLGSFSTVLMKKILNLLNDHPRSRFKTHKKYIDHKMSYE